MRRNSHAHGDVNAVAQRLYPILTPQVIARRVAELGGEISREYAGKDVLIVGVLKGSFMFVADLVRALTIPAQIDFVRLSSYGATDVPGEIAFTQDLELSVQDKHVLVVEDIVDTGHSMERLLASLGGREARSVKLCALIDKKERRAANVTVDFFGFRLAKGFVVGYGLDFAEDYRCLPGVFELSKKRSPQS